MRTLAAILNTWLVSALMICGLAAIPDFATAAEFDDATPEQFFMISFIAMCKPMQRNDQMIAKLQSAAVPEFPPTQAKLFLHGHEGHAWPIPYHRAMGNFVLALPTDTPICIMLGRRIDQSSVEQAFIEYATQRAPKNAVVEKREETITTVAGGYTGHTIAYTWAFPGQKKKILMMLSTNPSPTADLQAFATVNLLRE
jgi:hypothetical protein